MTRTKLTAVLCTVAATVATAVLAGAASEPRRRTESRRNTGQPPDALRRLSCGRRQSEHAHDRQAADQFHAHGGWLTRLHRVERVCRRTDHLADVDSNDAKGDATVVPREREGSTRATSSSGSPSRVCNYCSRRSSRPGCSSTTSGSFSGTHPVLYQVRVGDRMVTVQGLPFAGPSRKEPFTAATPDQTRALAWIAALVADPAGSLPTSVWANRQIRAFVPACYSIAFDRGYPDLSKLPPPAGKARSQYKQLKRHAYQVVTTRQARALLQAFVKAGISPQDNHAWTSASRWKPPRPTSALVPPPVPCPSRRVLDLALTGPGQDFGLLGLSP